MKRRRGFGLGGRPARPLFPPLDAGPRKALRRAHDFMEGGNYVGAAEIFERLARGARARGNLQRAPFLFLQAGRSRLFAGQNQRGVPLIQEGLDMLAESARWPALYKASRLAVAGLNQNGQAETVAEITRWLQATLPKDFSPNDKIPLGNPRPKPMLPPKCPFCGATLAPDEVEWHTEDAAECTYCGSIIQAI